MGKINDQRKELLKKLNQDPKSIGEILKKSPQKLGDEQVNKFNEYTEMFKKIKEDFDLKGIKTIGDRIREAKISKQDQLLTSQDQIFSKNLSLVMEKEVFIINSLKKILDTNLKLDLEIYPNFMKYLVSNYYRTMTESSIKICSEIMLLMINQIISIEQEDEKIKKYKDLKEDIEQDKLGLEGLKTIFSGYDKRFLKINISKIIDELFLFEEGKGFSLRNNITHERLLFGEIDFKLLENEIQRINLFNQSALIIFYIETFMKFATLKDLDIVNKIFGEG